MFVSSEQHRPTLITASNSSIQKKESNIHAINQSRLIFLQPKLTIDTSGDMYEKEADAMADKVMRMSGPEPISFSSSDNMVSRKCAECEEDEKKQLQRKEGGNDSFSAAPSIVHDVLNSSGGKSLDADTSFFMESRFKYDFSNVKIHDNDLAAKSASSINALAYTSGNNIVFNTGQYNPNSDAGKRLLAHELTHTLQQKKGISASLLQRQTSGPYHPPEGTELNCSMNDACPSISLKINYLRHTIKRHIEWDLANPDPAYPLGRHSIEIADLTRALETCIAIAQTKCRNQPEIIRVPVEQTEEEKAREEASKRQLIEQSPIPLWAKYVLYGIMAGIALILLYSIVAAIVACFATGVCEVGIIIGGLGVTATAAVLFIINRIKSESSSQQPAEA